MESLACDWNPAYLLVFSENVFEPLIYYSHLGPLVASLFLGILVLLNNPRELVNRVLFSITLFFSAWVFFDLILWASEKPDLIMFFWSAIVPIELLIYASSVYLVALFANNGKDTSLWGKIAVGAFFIPIILFSHTSYNLLGFDYTNCDRGAIEGPLIQYLYLIELLFIGWATIIAIEGYRKMRDHQERRQLLFVALGTVLFLLLFTAGNITLIFSFEWQYEQYKLFGMPIFLALLTYSIVKFKTFHAKLIAAQALVGTLALLILSLLFINSIGSVQIIAGLTFVLVCAVGYLLVKNVKKEIEQRELLEKLTVELEQTNTRQEGLIHYIGHEVKGFLTKDEAAFAALEDGDFGILTDGIKDFVTKALTQARDGVRSVTDILTASNQKKGTISYTKAPFDLKAAIAEVVEKERSTASQKGLAISFLVDDPSSPAMFNGDREKVVDNILRNLIENAINYTPTGSVTVTFKKSGGKYVLTVKDTGIGINPEDKKMLFTEGGHGKESQRVNAHSTGYGLFIAKNVVEGHGGTIRAESEGQGKGSTFTVELPAT